MKFFVLVIAIVASAEANDWCAIQAQHCYGREHIACLPNSFPMGQNVTNIQMVEMTPALIKVAVDRHNYHRSNVASGGVPGIPSASAMQRMDWHTDLAYLADVHARHGNFQHDLCRAVPDFPMSGQSLARLWSTAPFTNSTDDLLYMIDMWYNEMPIVRDTLPSCIDSFTISEPNCRPAGHFTVMVNDLNRALGCALVTFDQLVGNSWRYNIMGTCNYAGNNILEERTFARGSPCSACASVGRKCDATTSLCI